MQARPGGRRKAPTVRLTASWLCRGWARAGGARGEGEHRLPWVTLQSPGPGHPTQTSRGEACSAWECFNKHPGTHGRPGSAAQRVNERGDTREPPGAAENPGIYQTVGQGEGVSCEDLKHIPSAVAFLFQREPQVSHVLGGGGEAEKFDSSVFRSSDNP